jgi:hypothetical protein
MVIFTLKNRDSSTSDNDNSFLPACGSGTDLQHLVLASSVQSTDAISIKQMPGRNPSVTLLSLLPRFSQYRCFITREQATEQGNLSLKEILR